MLAATLFRHLASEIEEEESNKPVKQRSFILKFLELQSKMFSQNAGLTGKHPYQSQPIEWPFLAKGISFWTQNETRKQIYLIGNPIGMWIAAGSLAVIVGVVGADVLSRRRGFYPMNRGILFRKACFVASWESMESMESMTCVRRLV